MKKFSLFLSSMLGAISGFLCQDYWPTIQVPDSLNLFLSYPDNAVEIVDIDDDGFDDVLFYNRNNLEYTHLKGLGNGQFEEVPPDQSILNGVINSALSYFPDSVNWANEVGDWKIRFADIDNLGDTDMMISAGLMDSTAIQGEYVCADYGFFYDYQGAQRNYLVFTKNPTGDFNIVSEEIDALSPSCFDSNVEFSDFDNDGDIDIIKGTFEYCGKYCFNSYINFYQFDQIGANFELVNSFSTYITNYDGYLEPWFGSQFKFHDFNHDGYDDIWERRNLHLGNGNTLTNPVLNNFDEAVEIYKSELIPDLIPSNYLGLSDRHGLGDFENDGFTEWLIYDYSLSKWQLFTQKCSNNPVGEPCLSLESINPETCASEAFFNESCECELTQIIDSDLDGICDNEDLTNGDCELYGICDDGDFCTFWDEYDANCNCVGEFLDNDMDGICNALDQCPGQNDNVDNDLNGIPDCLEIQNEADFEEYDDGIIGPNPNPSDQKSLLEKQIQIFPNPSAGIFTIQSNLEIEKLNLFNSIGEELPVFISGQNQIDLSHFSNGIYFLELKTEEGILRKKIMKK